MAERVVDVLEAVDVEEQEADVGATLPRIVDSVLEALGEQPPVGEPGERVEQCEAGVLVGGRAQLAGGAVHRAEQQQPDREQPEGHDDGDRAHGVGQRVLGRGVVEGHLGDADGIHRAEGSEPALPQRAVAFELRLRLHRETGPGRARCAAAASRRTGAAGRSCRTSTCR